MSALSDNPLRTRQDLRELAVSLCTPLESHRSAGGARIRLNGPHARYTDTCQEMEGYSRVLWGLAPLLAGGGSYAFTDRLRLGLINGCTPDHPEYWGVASDKDQRLVEYGPIAFAMLIHPETFWTPLSAVERTHVARFLALINDRELPDNNWRFFRVLVNLALARGDMPFSAEQLRRDLDRLDAFYLGDGWYVDGSNRAVDYYGAFALHFYGLICVRFLRDFDAARANCFAERAEVFARDFMHWFSDDGAAIPYGRSLTYRFAQAAFWGALAFAGVEAVPWGVAKGILLRHLRWWLRQPILSESGLLTLGYAYPNQNAIERYSSPCSPYWALKALLPLALAGDGAFWRTEEEELPRLPKIVAQRYSGMILCSDGGDVFALAAAARVPTPLRHGAAKYGKFCYSTRAGFSVPSASDTLQTGAHDSALALSEAGDTCFRARLESDNVDISCARIVSRWTPYADVQVTTWLVPCPPWHVRVHWLRTARALTTAEG